jgi:hypothetical protein
MDTELEDLQDAIRALSRKWDLPVQEGVEKLAFDGMVQLLSGIIFGLLESDFEHLVNLMYRMDIPENQFRVALQGNNREEIALQLATLVVERELLRVRTWNAYQRRKKQGS